MASEWTDRGVCFVLTAEEPLIGMAITRYHVLSQYSGDDLWRACNSVATYADENKAKRVVVITWTLGRGIRQVAEYQGGKLQVTYSHYSRESEHCFAPVIMPAIAAYLDTQARSIAELRAEECGPIVGM